FVVIVFNIVAVHGYDGLVLATLMAGIMLAAAGFARLGDWIKYIPQPVITGFTSGIALIIFTSQVGDLLGLKMEHVPGDFIGKWQTFWIARHTADIRTMMISGGSLFLIIILRRFAPKWPAFLISITAAALAVWGLKLPLATIGSVFGGIPHMLPAPHFPM